MKTRYPLILTFVPAFLLVSVAVSMWIYIQKPGEEKIGPLEGVVLLEEVADDLHKLSEYVGKPGLEDEAGRSALRSVTAMVDGALGPENLGYEVHRTRGIGREGLLWPTLWLEVGGSEQGKAQDVMAVPQDDEGSAVAFAMALAKHLAGRLSGGRVVLVFYPPVFSEEDLRAELAERVGAADGARFLFLRSGEEKGAVLEVPAGEESVKVESWRKAGVALSEREGGFTSLRLPRLDDGDYRSQAGRLIALLPVVAEYLEGE
ncbi:MAG: hypothetical protein ACQKBY_10435 [Verrucomicrobiales bacterium]